MTKKEYLKQEIAIITAVLDGEKTQAEYDQWKKEHHIPQSPKQQTKKERKEVKPGTLQGALDSFLNYPRTIKTCRGPIVITSRKMIERGEVQLNGFVCTDSDQPVAKDDYIHFGYKRKLRVPNQYVENPTAKGPFEWA